MENKEREVLIRAIDTLTMDVMRLTSENELLLSKLEDKTQTHRKKKRARSENILTRGWNYLKREGFFPTIKKVIKKLFNVEG